MASGSVQTREDLNAGGCGSPNCTHDHSVLHLHARCHPQSGLAVEYHKADGCLYCSCRTCHKPVGVLQLSWRLPA